MLDIDYNKFADFFYSKMFPIIKEIENGEELKEAIKKEYGTLPTCIAIFGIVYCGGFFYSIFTAKNSSQMAGSIVAFIIHVVFFIALFFGSRHVCREKAKKKLIKKYIYSAFLKTVGLEYLYDREFISKAETWIDELCTKNKLVGYHQYVDIDDYVNGDIDGQKFSILDTQIYYRTKNGRVSQFNGPIFITKINKELKGETIIMPKSFINPEIKAGKTAVHLEDVEFEKEFEVYSTDQIEARYLLTTAFMERLLQFRKAQQCEVTVVFTRRTLFDANVFIFVNTGNDHFEIDYKNLYDKEQYYRIYNEIKEITKIIPTLKLEQNIGM